jgi:hypothetical protein
MPISLGVDSNLILYTIYIAIGVLLLVLIGLVIHLEIKVRRLLRGKDAKTLEDTILSIQQGWQTERKFKEEMQKYLLEVEQRLKRSVRSPETVRFNAFAGTGSGGSQSFATSYLDECGNGVIISSLAARERMSVFAKPVKAWHSDFELSPEEKEVLEKAKKAGPTSGLDRGKTTTDKK